MKKKIKKLIKKPAKKREVSKKTAPSAKVDLLKKYKIHEKDSGSAKVQIVLLTSEIFNLAKHLRKHPKDYDSKVGLLKMIGKRRRLLNYLQKSDIKVYESLIVDLGLRR